MSYINRNAKVIHCKVVYCGPSYSGKTTNIDYVYKSFSNQEKTFRSEIETHFERTTFYDFVPFDVCEIHGFQVRFHLYTVPGQMMYAEERKWILRGVDGLIFVADSQPERIEDNIASLKDLEVNLKNQGQELSEIPLVMQFNKRDLPNAAPLPYLRTQLNTVGAREVEASAFKGVGVLESLEAVSKSILYLLKSGSF